jgi:hypothetical protein
MESATTNSMFDMDVELCLKRWYATNAAKFSIKDLSLSLLTKSFRFTMADARNVEKSFLSFP